MCVVASRVIFLDSYLYLSKPANLGSGERLDVILYRDNAEISGGHSKTILFARGFRVQSCGEEARLGSFRDLVATRFGISQVSGAVSSSLLPERRSYSRSSHVATRFASVQLHAPLGVSAFYISPNHPETPLYSLALASHPA